MLRQKFSTYDVLETLEMAYEAIIRSIPDSALLGYESMDDAKKFHRRAMIAVGEKVREYRKLVNERNQTS
jgi:hypothetical protein